MWTEHLPRMVLCTCMPSCFSHVWLFVTPWTVAHQAPLSMGLPRQEYWSGLPCPSPGDIPDPEIEPTSLFPALAGGFFTTSSTWEASGDPIQDAIFTHQKVLPFCFQFKSAFGLGWYGIIFCLRLFLSLPISIFFLSQTLFPNVLTNFLKPAISPELFRAYHLFCPLLWKSWHDSAIGDSRCWQNCCVPCKTKISSPWAGCRRYVISEGRRTYMSPPTFLWGFPTLFEERIPWSYLFITFAIFQIIRHPYSFICSNVCLVESVTSCCFRKYWDDFSSQPISFPPEQFYFLDSWGLAYCIKWIGHCLEKSGGEGIRVPSSGNLFFNALQRNRCGKSWEQAWQEGCQRGGEKSNPSSNVKGSSS